MAEPFLEEVEGYAGGDGGDAEAVAESFRGGVGAGEPAILNGILGLLFLTITV